MTSRLSFCMEEIAKCKDKKDALNRLQEFNNLLPTYDEKAVLQDYANKILKEKGKENTPA